MPRLTPRPAWLPPLWVVAALVSLLALVIAGGYVVGTQFGASHAAESHDQAAPPAVEDDGGDEADADTDASDRENTGDEEDGPDEDPEESPADIDPESYYVLQSTVVERAIDVSGASAANNASVVLWDTHGEPNQQFRFVPVEGDTFEVVARHSDKAIQVVGDSGDGNNDLVTQLTSTGDPKQHWNVVEVNDNGVIRLVNDATGRPLVATGPENSDPVAQGGNEEDLQEWVLLPAE